MHKRTKALQFDKSTVHKIITRDETCIFCRMRYRMDPNATLAYQIKDIMHIVNKSQGGLGIEENGILGCRYHHGLLDNGNKGLRYDMLQIISGYMEALYPGWNTDDLVYKK